MHWHPELEEELTPPLDELACWQLHLTYPCNESTHSQLGTLNVHGFPPGERQLQFRLQPELEEELLEAPGHVAQLSYLLLEKLYHSHLQLFASLAKQGP